MEGGELEKIVEAAERIRRLEVQGATNVAVTAVRAMVELIEASEAEDRSSVLAEIADAREILFRSRETEPFMRNAVRYIEWRVGEAAGETAEELRDLIQGVSDELIRGFTEARRRIAEIGSRRIVPGSRVLTHCHSSAVGMV
ncbi:MAG: hypothetical protein ACE5OO_07235, partial [Candidatus Bathyarchaeia archaeon]